MRLINTILPSVNSTFILTEERTEHRARSTWIGLIMAVMNLPRMLFMGVLRFLYIAGVGLFTLSVALFMEVIYHPLMTFVGSIMLGLNGSLVDQSDTSIEGKNVSEMKAFERGAIADVHFQLGFFGGNSSDEDETPVEENEE